MKLISMVDFVLRNSHLGWMYNEKQIREYAIFLKQPLTLGMLTGKDALFKGFTKMNKWEEQYNERPINYKGEFFMWESALKGRTVEYLLMLKPELTPTALKQIGLTK